MDKAQQDGGSAFPHDEIHDQYPRPGEKLCRHLHAEQGMSLRDKFAETALPIAARHYEDGHPDGWEGIARHAYVIADAMLKARATEAQP